MRLRCREHVAIGIVLVIFPNEFLVRRNAHVLPVLFFVCSDGLREGALLIHEQVSASNELRRTIQISVGNAKRVSLLRVFVCLGDSMLFHVCFCLCSSVCVYARVRI